MVGVIGKGGLSAQIINEKNLLEKFPLTGLEIYLEENEWNNIWVGFQCPTQSFIKPVKVISVFADRGFLPYAGPPFSQEDTIHK